MKNPRSCVQLSGVSSILAQGFFLVCNCTIILTPSAKKANKINHHFNNYTFDINDLSHATNVCLAQTLKLCILATPHYLCAAVMEK